MEAETAQVSSFPLPPPYFDSYTNENVANGMVAPPPPSIVGAYTVFGEECNTYEEMLPSLQSTKIRCLYTPGSDPRQELKKLTRSLLAAFLDLLEILIRCPDSKERLAKLEDLKLLFINTHHLINEYRPHQARETLHLLLQVQLAERTTAVELFHKQFIAVSQGLANSLQAIPQELGIPEALLNEVSTVVNGAPSQTQNSIKSNYSKDDILCNIVGP